MRRSGFTILELIAVIGIIAVIGTAVIGGFSGMMKSVARRSAADSVRRALNLARQEACVDGNDTFLYPVDVNRYAIVRKAGTITNVGTGSRKVKFEGVNEFQTSIDGGKWILDEFADHLVTVREVVRVGNLRGRAAAQAEGLRRAVQAVLTDKLGSNARHTAFGQFGLPSVQQFSRSHSQNCISQKFETFVAGGVLMRMFVGVRTVRQRRLQQCGIPETVLQFFFQFLHVCSVLTRM